MSERDYALGVSALLVIDGWFHLLTPEPVLVRYAPDYVLFGRNGGLPIWVHRFMGALLVVGGAYTFASYYNDPERASQDPVVQFFVRVVAPLGIGLILAGLGANIWTTHSKDA